LESLQGLKSKGIIHGDLSLANILYHKKSNLVTLIDLGFSVTDNGDHKGLLLYTKRYRPPEVVLEKIPYRTDVDMWALGCILYQLITNKDLFEVDPNTPDFDLMAKIVNQCGGPPSLTYLEGCRHASRYFSAEGKSLNQFPKKERWKEEIKKCVENTTTASSLIAFLGKIFTYEDRISVEEALNDPLFTTCLQEEILHFTVDEPELRHNHLYILDPETKKRLRKVHLSLAPHADYCIHVPKQNSYLCTIKKPDKTELLSFQITSTTVSEEKEKES
jgi:serine/threonine protein kinase